VRLVVAGKEGRRSVGVVRRGGEIKRRKVF